MQDHTKRFSGRASDYAKYRPGYPKEEILNILRGEIEFDAKNIVADIGSGTGILARVFLENGNKVFGIEPNDDMREVAEETLRSRKFVSVKGTAENTTLPDKSADLISAGQALHWFDSASAPKEFKRIIAPNGYLCVIYNDRKVSNNRGEKFKIMEDYEGIVKKYSGDRPKVERVENEALSAFFKGWRYKKFIFDNEQELDFEGLVGRLASASYMPKEGERFASMKQDLREIFDENERNGLVTLYYETGVFLGAL